MKCKNSIINEMMDNAAEIIDNKIEFTKLLVEQFKGQGNEERARYFEADITEMTAIRSAIINKSGCWA